MALLNIKLDETAPDGTDPGEAKVIWGIRGGSACKAGKAAAVHRPGAARAVTPARHLLPAPAAAQDGAGFDVSILF